MKALNLITLIIIIIGGINWGLVGLNSDWNLVAADLQLFADPAEDRLHHRRPVGPVADRAVGAIAGRRIVERT